MTSRSYYKGGSASAVVPASINISTTPLTDDAAHAFTDVLKQQQLQQQQQQQYQRLVSNNERNYLSSPSVAAASPSNAAASSDVGSPAHYDAGAYTRSSHGNSNGAKPLSPSAVMMSAAAAPPPPPPPADRGATERRSSNVNSQQQQLYNPHSSSSTGGGGGGAGGAQLHSPTQALAATQVEDDYDGGDVDTENSANEPLDYCGVRLLPGVEQIDFDEGYYVGTIDENGEMAGYGKATWHTGDTYEGEWLDGMMHGKGTYTWTDGDYYKGEYVKGRMEGYGEMKDTTGLYTGEWVADMRQGYGRMVYAGGNIYEGEWLAGMRHGPGKLIEVAANVTYEGEFNRNEKEGRGVQTNAEGDVYEGEFANGKPNGRGTYLWSDGSRYIGMFKDGVKHGDGCEWLANGDWIAGMFQNGEHVDDNSTRHKAIHLSDEEEEDGGGEAAGAAAHNKNNTATVHSKHSVGPGLSDEAAAAVLEPLDAEQLRRITEPQRRPSASVSLSRRGSVVPSTATEAATSPTAYGSVRRTINNRTMLNNNNNNNSNSPTANAAGGNALGASTNAATSPLSMALNAPQVLLEDSELEGWTQLKTIGKGSFGAVYTALLRNGRTVCCKVIELGNVENEEEMEKLRNEIALMKRLHHPNCVQYYGSLEDKTKNTLNIFMEYVSGGTLTSFVNKFKSIPLNTLRQWAYQMVTGVKYLHECGIVHRDIKGDNVLVSVDGVVKLADFGCSKSIDDVCSATHGCSTMVGTPYWMAPEVIKCEAGGYGMKSDIWSLGCTIVEMLTGKPPWPECNSMWAAVYKIANSTGLPTEIPADVDPELMDLLEKCFERNPKLRPTAAELLKHPFLAKAAEGITSPTGSNA